jgi:hypothetical protein
MMGISFRGEDFGEFSWWQEAVKSAIYKTNLNVLKFSQGKSKSKRMLICQLNF